MFDSRTRLQIIHILFISLKIRHILAKLNSKPKANGVYKGRKTTIDRQVVEAHKASGLGPTATAIARLLNCDGTSVYRVLR